MLVALGFELLLPAYIDRRFLAGRAIAAKRPANDHAED